jgi:hypothetical protein
VRDNIGRVPRRTGTANTGRCACSAWWKGSSRSLLEKLSCLVARWGVLWSGRLDVEPSVFNGELDGLLIQLGVMSDSDRLEDDRDVDGVGWWSQSGQDVLDGLDAAGEAVLLARPTEKGWKSGTYLAQ